MASIDVAVNPSLPGSVRVVVEGAPMVGTLNRLDGRSGPQPVRNFTGIDAGGLVQVIDAEAPLGRAVTYTLVDSTGRVLATSAAVTCPPLPSGRALLRSVLRPQVAWMEVEGQDETGVEWSTSTTVHRVVGSDSPVVVGEVRQRRSGTMTFLCKSIADADQMVSIMRDGTPLLLRFDPCAGDQVRDLLFYALDVTERRYGRVGWRLLAVDYQSVGFVPGATDEPPTGWDYAAVDAAWPDYQQLVVSYRDYAALLMDDRAGAVQL